MAVKIRQGDVDDIVALVELGREMHAEAPSFNQMDYDSSKLLQLGVMLSEQGGMFLAEKDDKEIIGMFLGVIVPHFFGQDLMANDLCFFIKKDYRGGTVAPRLVKAFEQWAWANGTKVLRFGVSTGVEAERTLKLYEKLGYTQTGYLIDKYYQPKKEHNDGNRIRPQRIKHGD